MPRRLPRLLQPCWLDAAGQRLWWHLLVPRGYPWLSLSSGPAAVAPPCCRPGSRRGRGATSRPLPRSSRSGCSCGGRRRRWWTPACEPSPPLNPPGLPTRLPCRQLPVVPAELLVPACHRAGLLLPTASMRGMPACMLNPGCPAGQHAACAAPSCLAAARCMTASWMTTRRLGFPMSPAVFKPSALCSNPFLPFVPTGNTTTLSYLVNQPLLDLPTGTSRFTVTLHVGNDGCPPGRNFWPGECWLGR